MSSKQTKRSYSGPQYVEYYLNRRMLYAKIKGEKDQVDVHVDFGTGLAMFEAKLPNGDWVSSQDFGVVQSKAYRSLGIYDPLTLMELHSKRAPYQSGSKPLPPTPELPTKCGVCGSDNINVYAESEGTDILECLNCSNREYLGTTG